MNKRAAKALLFKGYFIAGNFISPRIGHFPLYPDHRNAFSRNRVFSILTQELAKAAATIKSDLIASREAAGVPFGVAVASTLKRDFLYLRKKPKGYNTNNVIEGMYHKGQSVVIVDDAMSTGGDKKEIVKTLEAAGLKVKGIIVIMDAFYGLKYRKAQNWLRKSRKYKFIALITWPGIMKYAADQKFLEKDFCRLIIKMLDDPFGWQKDPKNWKEFKQLGVVEKNLIFDESFDKI
ncbi:MAG: phosphoribosyltransferase family protein [Patescibacteria group bacterium]|jgi:orotate phosphoribosyltransferase